MDTSWKLYNGKGGDGGMVGLRTRRLRSKRGQSILEYLVITTVVVLSILAIRALVKTRTDELFGKSAERMGDAQKVLDANFKVGEH